MTTVLCFCRVADYDAWRPAYDRAVAGETEIRSYRVWRGQDDLNLVAIEETFDSREVAQAVWENPQTEQAMRDDGVDMASLRIEYVDEV